MPPRKKDTREEDAVEVQDLTEPNTELDSNATSTEATLIEPVLDSVTPKDESNDTVETLVEATPVIHSSLDSLPKVNSLMNTTIGQCVVKAAPDADGFLVFENNSGEQLKIKVC